MMVTLKPRLVFYMTSILVVILSAILLTPTQAFGYDFPTPPPLRNAEMTRVQFTPADVLARVALVRAELELIRFEMGKPPNRQVELQVSNVSPREVYFQSLTLFRKANRLARDLTADDAAGPALLPADQVCPGDVWSVSNAALARLLVVKGHLGISERSNEKRAPAETNPSDVFRSIVQANRQLNFLLDSHFVPSDVYQQVSLAVNYSERLLKRFPSAMSLPREPRHERGKRPSDVYRRLVHCYDLIQAIAAHSHIKMLVLTETDKDTQEKSPSDVYDIASLLVSEISYLHTLIGDDENLDEIFYPGRVFPAHVFQRAGVLELQLNEILKQAVDHPDWLAKEERP